MNHRQIGKRIKEIRDCCEKLYLIEASTIRIIFWNKEEKGGKVFNKIKEIIEFDAHEHFLCDDKLSKCIRDHFDKNGSDNVCIDILISNYETTINNVPLKKEDK